MRVILWLGAMVTASALAVATSGRWERPAPPGPQLPPEAPWLTREAADQIVGPDGGLGPLFAGVELGGPAPSPTVRARIAAFARANKVDIDLDVVDGALAALRFDVTFGGCCGYEGADVLAMRLGRPRTDTCCGCEKTWIDDWTFAHRGVFGRARVRVNRVAVRWEKEATAAEIVERADRLLGADRLAVTRSAGDHWIEVEPNQRYLLEMPYVIDEYGVEARGKRGIEMVVRDNRIVETSFSLHDDWDDGENGTMGVLRSRWGRPQVHHDDDDWSWQATDRIVTAALDSGTTLKVTVGMR